MSGYQCTCPCGARMLVTIKLGVASGRCERCGTHVPTRSMAEIRAEQTAMGLDPGPPKMIVGCVSARAFPDFPKMVGYSTYVEAECSTCPERVWLGMKGKSLVDAGIALIACPRCIALVHKMPEPTYLQLTEKD